MDQLLLILVNALAFYLAAQLLSGVSIDSFLQAVFLAIIIGILNITLGMTRKIVTLGILSLGIFNWLLDAIIIQVADYFLDGIKVKNFWWALALAAVVSILHSLIGTLI